MRRLRPLSAGLLTALAAAACDGSGGHNVPDEASQGAPGQDSMAAGTATPVAPAPGVVGQPTSATTPGGPAQPPTAIEQAGDDSPGPPATP